MENTHTIVCDSLWSHNIGCAVAKIEFIIWFLLRRRCWNIVARFSVSREGSFLRHLSKLKTTPTSHCFHILRKSLPLVLYRSIFQTCERRIFPVFCHLYFSCYCTFACPEPPLRFKQYKDSGDAKNPADRPVKPIQVSSHMLDQPTGIIGRNVRVGVNTAVLCFHICSGGVHY